MQSYVQAPGDSRLPRGSRLAGLVLAYTRPQGGLHVETYPSTLEVSDVGGVPVLRGV